MGTFASLFKEENSKIPESKREEFEKRIEELFQCGGMMQIDHGQLIGRKFATLRKAAMTDDGIHFYYNYFEEDAWESAGFSKKDCHIWSGKIGWKWFHRTMVAAYVLEEIYHDGIAVAMVNDDPVTSWGYVGWINYLFNEKNHVKNYDPWKLFETYYVWKKEEYPDMKDSIFHVDFDFGNDGYAFIGGCEICAVLHGTQKAIEVYEKRVPEERIVRQQIAMHGFKEMNGALQKFKENSEMDGETQLHELIQAIRAFCTTDDLRADSLPCEGKEMTVFLQMLFDCDAPAFAIKAISELYDEDFWKLWDQIKDVATRKFLNMYDNEGVYVVPIPTKDFFKLSDDDMILYWEEDGDVEFSEELWTWFRSLKSRYDAMLIEETPQENLLNYMIDLMDEADEIYFQILSFTDFFEETLNHLNDMRYHVLWKMYDEMIHDPELRKAGDLIFVPDEPGHEKEGVPIQGSQPERRLIDRWTFIPKEKKQNKGRQTLRRYNELLANRPLRVKVFGF